ncbi:MAG: insulinase family protein [Sandaracinaceae bacterium]|nr:insulinase family protein [Sandaracinaceae bacterium]
MLERRLDNGLRVLIQQGRRTPPRAWACHQYHVGFRTTRAASAACRIVEHLPFTRSERRAGGGGLLRAGRRHGHERRHQPGRHHLHVELPARGLDLALWIESDRMGYLITALDEAKVARERSVVLQEWRERVSRRASGWLTEVIQQQMCPVGHPYHLVGDDPNHVASIRLAHVQWFLQEYHVPNNATLAIVGDVDLARALASVERYFASIPPSRDPRDARARVVAEAAPLVDFEAPTHRHAHAHVAHAALPRGRRRHPRCGGQAAGPAARVHDRRAAAERGSAPGQPPPGLRVQHRAQPRGGRRPAAVPRHGGPLPHAAADQHAARRSLPAYRDAASNWITGSHEGCDSRAMSLATRPEGTWWRRSTWRRATAASAETTFGAWPPSGCLSTGAWWCTCAACPTPPWAGASAPPTRRWPSDPPRRVSVHALVSGAASGLGAARLRSRRRLARATPAPHPRAGRALPPPPAAHARRRLRCRLRRHDPGAAPQRTHAGGHPAAGLAHRQPRGHHARQRAGLRRRGARPRHGLRGAAGVTAVSPTPRCPSVPRSRAPACRAPRRRATSRPCSARW